MAEAATKQAKAPSETTPARRPSWAGWPALFERELDTFFDDLFDEGRGGRFRLPALLRRLPALAELPRLSPVDVYQTDDEVVVKAEMPGLAKEDIDVSLTDSRLTIKGEKKREEKIEEENYHRSERSFGMISRTIDLPCECKTEQAKAKMTNGVLEVRIPKSDEAKKNKPVKISVS